jgi:hypothetical protein
MIGWLGTIAWVVVGVIVSAVEKRSDEGADITAVSVIGAVAGASIAQQFRLFIGFGEIVGFVCAALGAKLALSVYRSQTIGLRPRQHTHVPATADPAPAPVSAPQPGVSIGLLIVQAFGWGVMCAMTTAIVGVIGHFVGSQLYPQQYEQIPSDFFFFPLGLLLGFVAAGVGRIAGPSWGAPGMFALVALVTMAYGGLMFEYSRMHALPALLSVSIAPDPASAVSCDRDCNATDPPLQWTVRGYLRLMEKSGLGATVDDIQFTSDTPPRRGPVSPHRYTKAASAEANRWRGPEITLTGRHIPGPRHVRANEPAMYELRYSYHTPEGSSPRKVNVYVHYTDGAGRKDFALAEWNVR